MENNNEMHDSVDEAALENITGGKGGTSPSSSPTKCRFVHTGGEIKEFRAKHGGIVLRAQCGTVGVRCNSSNCKCWGKDHCVDRWHEVTPNGSALPRSEHESWYE